MRAKIIYLEKEFNKQGQHNFFHNTQDKIMLYEVRFKDINQQYRCGTMSNIPPYKVGDTIEFHIIKNNYIGISKVNSTFTQAEKPLINKNAEIAIHSTEKSIDLLKGVKHISFKTNEGNEESFGKDDIKRLSRIIADLIIDTQLYLDSK